MHILRMEDELMPLRFNDSLASRKVRKPQEVFSPSITAFSKVAINDHNQISHILVCSNLRIH